MKTKEFYLKLKQKLVVLSIFVTSLFLMSSCSILGTIFSPLTDDTYAAHGYHFSAKDSYGQTLCYEILNDNEVALVIPSCSERDYEFKLPENVIVPKTIKYNGKNYTVSALYSLNNNSYSSGYISRKGTYEIRCKNLVIPETVKVIDCRYSRDVQNVIYYGDSSTPQIKYFSKGLCERCLEASSRTYDAYKRQWDARGKKEITMSGKNLGQNDKYNQFYLHVMPNCSASFSTDNNKNRVVNIAGNYNIYEEGHSLAEYLEKSKASVDLAIKREKYKNGLWVPSPNGMVLCFRKIKNSNNEVELDDIILEKGEVDSLIVPKTITDYDGNTYTVTSIDRLSGTIRSKGYISQYRQTYVVLPETVKRFGTGSGIPREIICYSPDIEISVSMDERKDVFHFPQGHANKIMEKTTNPFPYVEIVDNYDIYQEGNSLKEYIAKSRAAVKKAKEDFAVAAQAALAAEKAAEEKKAAEWQAQQEAEAKRIRKELTRKYGANYMNAVQKGDLTIGMPKELVRYGLQNRLFKKFTSMDLDSQTATREVYDLYYTSLQTIGLVLLTEKCRVSTGINSL